MDEIVDPRKVWTVIVGAENPSRGESYGSQEFLRGVRGVLQSIELGIPLTEAYVTYSSYMLKDRSEGGWKFLDCGPNKYLIAEGGQTTRYEGYYGHLYRCGSCSGGVLENLPDEPEYGETSIKHGITGIWVGWSKVSEPDVLQLLTHEFIGRPNIIGMAFNGEHQWAITPGALVCTAEMHGAPHIVDAPMYLRNIK